MGRLSAVWNLGGNVVEYLSLMFGGAGRGFVDAALVACLFWAAVAHPERIRSVFLFRVSGLILGVSILAPVLVQLFAIGQQGGGPMRPPGFGSSPEFAMYALAIPPALSMLAVVFGLMSVVPPSGYDRHP